MSEVIGNKKILWITVASIAFICLIAAGSYSVYYLKSKEVEKKATNEETKTVEEYPAETIIKDTDDANVKVVTPSKDDSIQIKSESGESVTVPAYKVPKKN